MEITKIHIYGFGKWTDQAWDLEPSGIQLIYGQNEAGKSTFMSFIFAILFGFPKKGANQFFPKSKESYGGSLTIQSARFGEVVVERVKGRRVKGEVSVQFSDGRVGGEAELEAILHEMDEKSFQASFYFDLDGLGGLRSMGPEELNEFLYDTSISGGKSISSLEQQLQKDMEKLFKPQGKKTEMNALAFELQDKERKIKVWEERLDEYDQLLDSKSVLEEEVARNKKTLDDLLEKIKELSRYEMLKKLVKEWQEKKIKLSEQEEIDFFPENGVPRLENLLEKKLEKEVHLKDELTRCASINQKLTNLSFHDEWDGKKEKLSHFIKQFEFIQKLEQDIKREKLEIEQKEKKKRKLEKSWEIESFQEPIAFADTSYQPFMKKKLLDMKERWSHVKAARDHSQRELEEVEQDIVLQGTELKAMEESLLPKDERDSYLDILDKHDGKTDAIKKDLLLERLQERKKEQAERKKREHRGQSFLLLLLGLSAISFALSIILFDTPIKILLGIVTIAFAGAYFWKRKETNRLLKNFKQKIAELEGQINELEKSSLGYEHEKISTLKEKLAKDDLLISNYQKASLVMETLQIRLKKIQDEMLKNEEDILRLQADLKKWCQDHGLPYTFDFPLYESLLQDLEDWHRLDEQEDDMRERRDLLQADYQAYSLKVADLFTLFFPTIEEKSLFDQVGQLKIFFKDHEKKEQEKTELRDQLAYREEAVSRIELEISHIQEKIAELLQKGQGKSEEEFRSKERAYKEQRQLKDEISSLWIQMKQVFSEDDHELNKGIHLLTRENFDPGVEHDRLSAEKSDIEAENERLRDRIAEINSDILTLQEDGTYEELQFQFAQQHEELQALLAKWSSLAISKGIIDEVKRVYEQERQPQVLREAESYFHRLTSGDYTKLYAPLGEERFIVERKDGIRFEAYELSRGTCELLYLSLRLALASMHNKKHEAMPFMMDETFVNIDKFRMKNIIQVLDEIAKSNQIFIFTCHQHIKQQFQGKEISL